MTRCHGRLRLFGLSLALATVAAVTSVVGVGAASVAGGTAAVTASCSGASSGSGCAVGFKFTRANGTPSCNVTVNFSVSGVPGASVNPTTATTDCNGNVLAAFSAGTTGCGNATITATSGTASAQTVIPVRCSSGGQLPNTSAVPPSTPSWLAALVALALVTVAAGGLTLRRMRVTS